MSSVDKHMPDDEKEEQKEERGRKPPLSLTWSLLSLLSRLVFPFDMEETQEEKAK